MTAPVKVGKANFCPKFIAAVRCAVYLAALIAILSSGAFAAKPKPASVTINAPVETIKAAMLRELVAAGFQVDSDSQFQLIVSRDVTGAKGLATRMLIGNAYSEDPRESLRFTLVPGGSGGVIVSGEHEVSNRMVLGNVNRVKLDNKKQVEGMQRLLDQVKSSAEVQDLKSSIPAPSSKAATAEPCPAKHHRVAMSYGSSCQPDGCPDGTFCSETEN